MKKVWEIIVEKGRLAQWLICGGGMLLCILGGLDGFLTEDSIVQVVLALIAATFALEHNRH